MPIDKVSAYSSSVKLLYADAVCSYRAAAAGVHSGGVRRAGGGPRRRRRVIRLEKQSRNGRNWRLEVEFESFLEVLNRIFFRLALASDIDLQTLRHEPIIFLPNTGGKMSFH